MNFRWLLAGVLVGLLVSLWWLGIDEPNPVLSKPIASTMSSSGSDSSASSTSSSVPTPFVVVDAGAMCAFRPTLEGRLPPELEALGEAWPPHEEEWLRAVEEGAEGR